MKEIWTPNGQDINGTRGTMQDTFPNSTKAISNNITHTNLHTPSTNSTGITLQHRG